MRWLRPSGSAIAGKLPEWRLQLTRQTAWAAASAVSWSMVVNPSTMLPAGHLRDLGTMGPMPSPSAEKSESESEE
jgi:hypothetical protein